MSTQVIRGGLWLPADVLGGALKLDAPSDCGRPEARDMLRRVLAAGEECSTCGGPGYVGQTPDNYESCADCGGGARGSGYTRPPHRLGWITDAEEAGVITSIEAAGLWYCSALRVDDGLGPVSRMPMTVGTCFLLQSPGCPAGVALAKDAHDICPAFLIDRGYAVLTHDHVVLPMPHGIIWLDLETP